MRKYLLQFSASTLLVASFFLALSFYFGMPAGDLTRVGYWSERDFHPSTVPSETVLPPAAKTSVDGPVQIIGDSFSASHEWQALAFTAASNTVHFDDVACVEEWLDKVLANSAVDTVVIESVEREFIKRFGPSRACKPVATTGNSPQPQVGQVAFSSFMPDARYLMRTLVNTVRTALQPGKTIRSGAAVSAALDPDCAKFSNRRADRLLYYLFDEEKYQWSTAEIEAAVQYVQHLQRKAEERGRKFAFILVPDKLSVYRQCLKGEDVRYGQEGASMELPGRFERSGIHSPDLHRLFIETMPSTMDFYLPNDTHLGRSGYALLAQGARAALKMGPPTLP